jgi:site-specific DNA-methyltransferase (adenine-specific)
MTTPWTRHVKIGDCDLYLGDCLAVMPALGKVGHVISDPPFEQIMHDLHEKAVFRRKDGGSQRKHFTFKGIDEIRPELIRLIGEYCDGWFLAFCTAEGVANWRSAVVAGAASKFKTTCIWVKPDCAPKFNGQGPAVGYEPFVTVWAGAGVAKWNAGGKRGVYKHNTNPPDRHGTHPTEKPWRLFYEILCDFTGPAETILDPFMGSGTTLVACAKLGRKGIGIELDPDYFETACRRVQAAYDQPDLFVAPPTPATQDGFDL